MFSQQRCWLSRTYGQMKLLYTLRQLLYLEEHFLIDQNKLSRFKIGSFVRQTRDEHGTGTFYIQDMSSTSVLQSYISTL